MDISFISVGSSENLALYKDLKREETASLAPSKKNKTQTPSQQFQRQTRLDNMFLSNQLINKTFSLNPN